MPRPIIAMGDMHCTAGGGMVSKKADGGEVAPGKLPHEAGVQATTRTLRQDANHITMGCTDPCEMYTFGPNGMINSMRDGDDAP